MRSSRLSTPLHRAISTSWRMRSLSRVSCGLRLYAAKVDLDDKSFSPVTADKLTPTDVVVSVTAIVRAAVFNLWDLSMWFQRPRR